MGLRKLLRKLKYGVRADSETYINYLRKLGMVIGDRTVIFDPRTNIIDETRPWMIKMGNDVQITAGVTILTHGYDWSVLKGVYGEILGSGGGGRDWEQCVYWNALYDFKGCTYRK